MPQRFVVPQIMVSRIHELADYPTPRKSSRAVGFPSLRSFCTQPRDDVQAGDVDAGDLQLQHLIWRINHLVVTVESFARASSTPRDRSGLVMDVSRRAREQLRAVQQPQHADDIECVMAGLRSVHDALEGLLAAPSGSDSDQFQSHTSRMRAEAAVPDAVTRMMSKQSRSNAQRKACSDDDPWYGCEDIACEDLREWFAECSRRSSKKAHAVRKIAPSGPKDGAVDIDGVQTYDREFPEDILSQVANLAMKSS